MSHPSENNFLLNKEEEARLNADRARHLAWVRAHPPEKKKHIITKLFKMLSKL